MRRAPYVLVVLLGVLLLPVPPARAALPVTDCGQCGEPTARGGEGTITVAHGVSDVVPGRGSATQGRGKGDHDYSYVNEFAAPTCQGSGLHDNGVLCAFALTSCPALDQVRFWIWHQTVSVIVTVTVGDPDVVTKGQWQQLDGTFCLGPDDPGVPSIVRTLAKAQEAFQSRVRDLPAPTVRSTPGPRTLVHYLTSFAAQNTAPFTYDVTVAGATVHLHAHPTRFRWSFGDGSTTDTTGPESDHTYADRGARAVRVDVTWGGWFTVDGSDEHYAIDPPARAAGTPTALIVVEALAQNLS